MRAAATICSSLLLAAPSFAQTVTASITTANQLEVHASSPGWPVQNGITPPNTAGFGISIAQTPNAEMRSEWDAFAHPFEARASWRQRAAVYASPASLAWTAPGDLLVSLQATVAVPVVIELSHVLAASAGAAVPAHGIDLGDDGSFEIDELSPPTFALSVVLGSTPLAIRLRSQLVQVGTGVIELELGVRVLPQNNLSINAAVAGCALDSLFVQPSFAGRGFATQMLTIHPTVLVLGLGVQPVTLPAPPSPGSGFPCLLLPSPDLLVLTGFAQGFELALPAAVRPLTLWVQGVVVAPAGLGTTTGYSVTAF
ncbi:MAG TPA: hypothetical protein VFZ65_02695 [Planctomycetota bacterium]|nr:hypothetical protein [Planctomycetota bacterium]